MNSDEPAAEWVPVDDLAPWAANPRVNDHVVASVAASIERFGFASPIIARRGGEVIAGHTRLKAAQSLGLASVPVRYLDLSEAEAHALALADNRLSELADWDLEALAGLAAGIDLSGLGWTDEEAAALGGLADPVLPAAEMAPYTNKIVAPIYEPKGKKPEVSALYDTSKADQLTTAIREADIPAEVAQFLMSAAQRHTSFHFGHIAEYYAHTRPDIQRLFEASALVIVDFEAAVENGFITLSKRMAELVGRSNA